MVILVEKVFIKQVEKNFMLLIINWDKLSLKIFLKIKLKFKKIKKSIIL